MTITYVCKMIEMKFLTTFFHISPFIEAILAHERNARVDYTLTYVSYYVLFTNLASMPQQSQACSFPLLYDVCSILFGGTPSFIYFGDTTRCVRMDYILREKRRPTVGTSVFCSYIPRNFRKVSYASSPYYSWHEFSSTHWD